MYEAEVNGKDLQLMNREIFKRRKGLINNAYYYMLVNYKFFH